MKIITFKDAYRVAHASATDTVTKRLRIEGRNEWTYEDYCLASETMRAVLCALGYSAQATGK